jgi:hypothetical protein
MVMTMEAFDLPELQHLAHLPEITLDVYKALPRRSPLSGFCSRWTEQLDDGR